MTLMMLMMTMSIHPPCARVPRSNKTSQAASLENQTPSPDDDGDDDDGDGGDDDDADVSGRQFREPTPSPPCFHLLDPLEVEPSLKQTLCE